MDKIYLSDIASTKFRNSSNNEREAISLTIDKYLIDFEKFKDSESDIKKLDSDFYKIWVNSEIALIINFSDNIPKITDIEFIKQINNDLELNGYGCLPSPEILKEYERIEPGSTSRIFELAEKQAQHRMELEKNLIRNELKRVLFGQVLAFVILILFVATGIFIALNYENKNVSSILLISFGGIPIILNFIITMIRKNK